MRISRRESIRFGGVGLISSFAAVRGSTEPTPMKTRREKNTWKCVYGLNPARHRVAGSAGELAAAIRRGADLRINTAFRHNEHIDTTSKNPELIEEVADFRITYLLDDRWAAGIINLRQPISLPDGFGPRPSMSFFLYNQNGQQAVARPHMDGGPVTGTLGPSPLADHRDMPKYHEQESWDAGTNAPSSNFIYDFEKYRFWVHDEWQEMLAHTADGQVLSGSIDALAEAFLHGCDIKVGIRGLCADLAGDPASAIDHEVFVQVGSCYYYTKRKLFMAASHPVVRVKPAIPLCYSSRGWDFGWLMPRTDGFVARWLVDPYTLKFQRSEGRYAIRWFVR